LGGLRASQLVFWPQVLDAFAAIRPGEVSEPVETRFGFHVFLRQSPPAEEAMSGQHIVISHERVKWAGMATCKAELPRRTRDEALSLATTIFHDVQAHTESFADAVQRYSDDCDVAVGGDFGSWSSREVAPFERRLDVLRTLAPGETAPPRETHVGFEIIRRTPERPRQRLAAGLISIQFDPWAADSRESALQKGLQAARELEERPARFAEFQSLYCCGEPAVWEEGREPPGLRSILASLTPGQISSEPLRAPGAYVLARKLDATEFASPTPLMAELELPAPDRVPLRSLLVSFSFDEAGEKLSRLSRESAEALGLSPAVAGRLSTLLEGWAATTEALAPEQREALLDAALEESRALLNDDLYASYSAALDAGMAELALAQPLPMF
jgi:PPIC-type PPIASE domain